MVEKKYVDFLNKLINDTKEKKVFWKYLDTNKELYKNMGWTTSFFNVAVLVGNEDKERPDFDREDSFYARISNTFVVLYVWGNQPAKLYVIPETYKIIVALTPDEYGEHITRLLNLVQSQFPNAETFIDNFLNTDKN